MNNKSNKGFRSTEQDVQYFNWQEIIMPQVKHLLLSKIKNLASIRTSTKKEDTTEATDLVATLKDGRSIKIAVRMRKWDCIYRDVTIRKYNCGCSTEVDKIQKIDYYFYCWCTKDDKIGEYLLFKVEPLIKHNIILRFKNYNVHENPDKKSSFFVIPVSVLSDIGAVRECTIIPKEKDLINATSDYSFYNDWKI